MIKIHYLHVKDMTIDITYGIIGTRSSGKTTFVNWWLFHHPCLTYEKNSLPTLIETQFLHGSTAHAAIVLDRAPTWKRDKKIEKVFFSSRRLQITCFMVAQVLELIPMMFRGCLGYVIIMGTINNRKRKYIYDNYWNCSFGNFKLFNSICDKVFSQKFTYLVLDNCSVKKGVTKLLEDYVFFGRGHIPKI